MHLCWSPSIRLVGSHNRCSALQFANNFQGLGVADPLETSWWCNTSGAGSPGPSSTAVELGCPGSRSLTFKADCRKTAPPVQFWNCWERVNEEQIALEKHGALTVDMDALRSGGRTLQLVRHHRAEEDDTRIYVDHGLSHKIRRKESPL